MREGHYKIPYKPLIKQSRFGLLSWPFYDEHCYTEDELKFRETILELRLKSGMDEAYLQTNQPWFNEDKEGAFIDVNQASWFFAPLLKPKRTLTSDDFYIPWDDSRIVWSELSVLTRKIGDYLLIRNKNLPPEHYNQPLNYALTDIAKIVYQLSLRENPKQTFDELKKLSNYLHAIEIHISPMSGSDRLFLADCRRTLETGILVTLELSLDSQILRLQLEDFHKQLHHLAVKRHDVLHFAFSIHDVNAHSYLEDYINNKQRSLDEAFPTTAARLCAEAKKDFIDNHRYSKEIKGDFPSITKDVLQDCQQVQMIDSLSEENLEAYAQGLRDLQQVVKYQQVVEQLLHFLDQAGEVFTTLQFRQQMLDLLQTMGQFISRSHHNILQVLESNTQIYHQMVQRKQDLNWWQKLMTKEQERIDNYIKNQDNLARSNANPVFLHEASNSVLDGVGKISSHLKEHQSQEKQLALVEDVRLSMEYLMKTMHFIISTERVAQGLPAPEKPSPHFLLAEPEAVWELSAPQSAIRWDQCFWSASPQMENLLSLPGICNESSNNCEPVSFERPASVTLITGFFLFLPIGLLAWKLFSDHFFKDPDLTYEKAEDKSHSP